MPSNISFKQNPSLEDKNQFVINLYTSLVLLMVLSVRALFLELNQQ